jgi:hypothetical protein
MAARWLAYASVGRFGLGHSMLAWARAAVWCRPAGVPMLAPQWLQPRLGPYLRGERDKREYFRLFNSDGYVTGLTRLYHLAATPRLAAEKGLPDPAKAPAQTTLVTFTNPMSANFQTYFRNIVGHHDLVRRELVRMTRPRYRPAPPACPHIAIHIRLGDFTANVDLGRVREGVNSARLPNQWYCDMLTGMRARSGAALPALVYSDGSDEEIADVLTMPGVSRAPDGAAVTDMLSMAQATVLLSSSSGFPVWSSYLGQVPRLSFPGQRKERVIVNGGGFDAEPECETPDEIPDGWLGYMRAAARG